MIKFILGIIMICAGIIGGYLAKDGWNEISEKAKKNPSLPQEDAQEIKPAVESKKDRSGHDKKIKISKIRIRRVVEDLESDIKKLREDYVKGNDQIAGEFNMRGTLQSGMHIKAQMDYATESKDKAESLFREAKRKIQDIILVNFNITVLKEISEFIEEKRLLEAEENKKVELYKLIEDTVKKWDHKCLGNNQLTAEFKL